MIPNVINKINMFSEEVEKHLNTNPYMGYAFDNSCEVHNISEEDK